MSASRRHGAVSRCGRWLVAGLFLAACSGSDADPVEPPPPTTPPSVVADDDGDDTAIVVDDVGQDEPIATDRRRRVTASVTAGDLDETIEVEIDPAALDGVDPFGRFAACSGSSRNVGVYSLLVASPDGPIRSLSLLSVERIGGAGIHDADVRIETGSGEVIAAVGTITLQEGLRDGSFNAVGRDGRVVSGTFSCEADGDGPATIRPGPADGVLDTVEVFVLLRSDDQERVVGLAIAGDDPVADVVCPGATGATGEAGEVGATGDLLVRVDGANGALSTVDLVGGAEPAMRLQLGGAVYEFDDLSIVVDETATSGSFTVDTPVDTPGGGVVADGAFSCS